MDTRELNHRERLLASAAELLREKGSLDITARELVTRSGTNLASIGYHFGSKDALIDEAVLQVTAEMTALAETAGGVGAPLAHRLAAFLMNSDNEAASDTAWFAALARLPHSPRLAEGLSDHYIAAHQQLVPHMPQTHGVDVDSLSWLIVALADGLLVQRLVLGKQAVSEEMLADALNRLMGRHIGDPTNSTA